MSSMRNISEIQIQQHIIYWSGMHITSPKTLPLIHTRPKQSDALCASIAGKSMIRSFASTHWEKTHWRNSQCAAAVNHRNTSSVATHNCTNTPHTHPQPTENNTIFKLWSRILSNSLLKFHDFQKITFKGSQFFKNVQSFKEFTGKISTFFYKWWSYADCTWKNPEKMLPFPQNIGIFFQNDNFIHKSMISRIE